MYVLMLVVFFRCYGMVLLIRSYMWRYSNFFRVRYQNGVDAMCVSCVLDGNRDAIGNRELTTFYGKSRNICRELNSLVLIRGACFCV